MCFGAKSSLRSASRVPTRTSGATVKNWSQIGCSTSRSTSFVEGGEAEEVGVVIAFSPRFRCRASSPVNLGPYRLVASRVGVFRALPPPLIVGASAPRGQTDVPCLMHQQSRATLQRTNSLSSFIILLSPATCLCPRSNRTRSPAKSALFADISLTSCLTILTLMRNEVDASGAVLALFEGGGARTSKETHAAPPGFLWRVHYAKLGES